jgi:hypothetical protein
MLRPLSYTDVLADGDTLWSTSLEGGLLAHSLATGEFSVIAREAGGLASNQLTTLALDASDQLWVGTQGSGVNRYSADRSRLSLLNVFDGLPSDTVNVLEVEADTVWIGTSRGIALWNGVYDMIGNVIEWTNDWYDLGYYAFMPKQNPKGPDAGMYRSVRGGGWAEGRGEKLANYYRNFSDPETRSSTIGFRCAK